MVLLLDGNNLVAWCLVWKYSTETIRLHSKKCLSNLCFSLAISGFLVQPFQARGVNIPQNETHAQLLTVRGLTEKRMGWDAEVGGGKKRVGWGFVVSYCKWHLLWVEEEQRITVLCWASVFSHTTSHWREPWLEALQETNLQNTPWRHSNNVVRVSVVFACL